MAPRFLCLPLWNKALNTPTAGAELFYCARNDLIYENLQLDFFLPLSRYLNRSVPQNVGTKGPAPYAAPQYASRVNGANGGKVVGWSADI